MIHSVYNILCDSGINCYKINCKYPFNIEEQPEFEDLHCRQQRTEENTQPEKHFIVTTQKLCDTTELCAQCSQGVWYQANVCP